MLTRKMFHKYNATIHRGKDTPLNLRDTGVDRVLNRKVIGACPFLGSYGMGGPGFFGIQLEKTDKFPEEWLVLTMWGSDEWLMFNGHILDCHPSFRAQLKPLLPGGLLGETEGVLTGLLQGKIIKSLEFKKQSFTMTFDAGLLELPEDLSRLAPFGNGKQRKWEGDEEMIDGFIISDDKYIEI